MKNQILTLVIGILIGAIIATGVFLVLKDNNKDKNKFPNMGERGQITERRNFKNRDNQDDNKTTNDKDSKPEEKTSEKAN